MPQLDTLTYFTQFIFLLVSFLFIYYFVITFIIPSTLTVRKLREKFNNDLETSQETLRISSKSEDQALVSELALEGLTLEAFTKLASKSIASTTVEDLNTINKASKHNIQSALILHHTNALLNKKRLVDFELTNV